MRDVGHILCIVGVGEGAVRSRAVNIIFVGADSGGVEGTSLTEGTERVGVDNSSLVALASDKLANGSPDFDSHLVEVTTIRGTFSYAYGVESLEGVFNGDDSRFANRFF